MQIEHKITIDLLEFVKTGKFDYLKLGKTKDWVLSNFPNPDGAMNGFDAFKEDIWCYGDIELHFNRNELFLIHSDNIHSLDGGESLEFKKWIFSLPDNLNLPYVIDCLIQERINFRIENHVFGREPFVDLCVIESGVLLGFSLVESIKKRDEVDVQEVKYMARAENYFLHGFSLSRT